jgi:hypothetical protein
MRLVRRLVPELGLLTVAGTAWSHRGTVLRLADLATEVPRLLREEGVDGVVRHGRVVVALDRAMPADLGVRISGLADGSVTLAGDPGPEEVSAATEALCRVRGVTDVRTDGTSHPVEARVVAGPPSAQFQP